MTSKYLVLGATGSIGYAFTKVLIDQKIYTTIIVRNTTKAKSRFGESEFLEIIEGDALDENLVKTTAADKQFIFHGINYPYDHRGYGAQTKHQKG